MKYFATGWSNYHSNHTNPPKNADAYRFDSIAVKEPTFEIDGVFLPPENEGAGVVYFCEVQFQKDKRLYERLLGASHF